MTDGLWWIKAESKELERFRRAVYNSKAWKNARAYVLASNPFCVHCERDKGILTRAVDVDHIINLAEIKKTGNTALAFSIENLQGLCKSCHSKKSYNESLNKNNNEKEKD